MKREHDEGTVKFQNSFGYYDIMYALYKEVVNKSLKCSDDNATSVLIFYKVLKELTDTVKPFFKKEAKLMVEEKCNKIKPFIIKIKQHNSQERKNLYMLYKLCVPTSMFLQDFKVWLFEEMAKEDLTVAKDRADPHHAIRHMN